MSHAYRLFCFIVLFPGTLFADVSDFLPSQWEYSAPLIGPEDRAENPSHAQKDPTVVFHDGKWHVFMTVRLEASTVIEYVAFKEWSEANAAKRVLLPLTDQVYFCAPQVFYFEPHHLWYLVYQAKSMSGQNKMWVAFSTTNNINDPQSWTTARPMLDGGPEDPRTVGGLDYWIICDREKAYLFFTSLNGKMWRLWTTLDEFPNGFRDCQVALEAKIFEASHIYRVKGEDKYLAIIEEDGRRYQKAYVAERLDGAWKPLADTEAAPFAGAANTRPAKGVEAWTDNISHGELIRDRNDQSLTIDLKNLRYLFQGMLENQKSGIGYGAYPWRLGLLSPSKLD